MHTSWRTWLGRSPSLTSGTFKPNILRFSSEESSFWWYLAFVVRPCITYAKYSEIMVYGNPILSYSIEIFRTLFLSEL